MNSIYIVEDEPIIARTIKTALEAEGFTVCGMNSNGKEALYDIEELQPDLVLLDITLEGAIDGVTVAEKIQKKNNIPFIFLTSLSDPETIDRVKRTQPAGYINKPFTIAGLRSSIEIALFNHKEQEVVTSESESNAAIFIKNRGEFTKLLKQDIFYFEAYDFYCFAHTPSGKTLVSKTLKYVEENLNDSTFLRVHRSYIVNINRIEGLHEGYVTVNKQHIPVSKTNKEKLLNSISLL